jgi:hypothetical protein
MESVLDLLERLGWPVDDMSDAEIRHELCRRWFTDHANIGADPEDLSDAALLGIVSAFSRQGNLDALCWQESDEFADTNIDLPDEADHYEPADAEEPPATERRRYPRQRARDLVKWVPCDIPAEAAETTAAAGPPTEESTGWLICRGAGGIAFIAETADAPSNGERIEATIHSRHGGVLDIGTATIIRQEVLSDELRLVCAELDDVIWSLSDA